MCRRFDPARNHHQKRAQNLQDFCARFFCVRTTHHQKPATMKTIILSLFALTLAQTDPTPSAKEVATQMCSCGKSIAQTAQTHAALKESDPRAYANHLEKSAKEMMGCLGGQEAMENFVKGKSYQQRMDFEKDVLKEMESTCPDVAAGLRSAK